jgi:hypothetical protein
MDLDQKKEQFSNAFIHAAAGAAGFAISKPSLDEDSIDWTISKRGGGGTLRSPKLDLQLKSTAATEVLKEKFVHYPLKVKNYEELRHENVQVARILVLVLIPPDLEQWMEQTEEKLTLRSCAYWMSLRGFAPTTHNSTVTVHLPREQRFDAKSLAAIMTRIGNRELP